MNETGTVTVWLEQFKAGDRDQAVAQLLDVYFKRLVGMARVHLGDRPRRMADEEDVALSAFNSFIRAAERGRFPRLNNRDDLWQVLLRLIRCKAVDYRHAEAAKKRGGGRVVPISDLESNNDEPLDLLGREPDPAEATALAEAVELRLEQLNDPVLRRVALLKLEEFTNEEIAQQLGCSLPTVERKLRRIRELWQADPR